MFSRYAKDMFAFRKFVEDGDYSVQALNTCVKGSAHVKLLDYIFKYAGLLCAIQDTGGGICESGSSLYGWIDEAIACDMVFHRGKNIGHIKSMKYVASDISAMMNMGAKALHDGICIHESGAPTISELVGDIQNRLRMHLALFYGLSVSVRYAVRNAKDLWKMACVSDLSIYNRLSLSLDKTRQLLYGTGKFVYVVSLSELVNLLNEAGFIAKFCTANMQYFRDGKESVRMSLVISKDASLVDRFISEYEYCVDMAIPALSSLEKGTWMDLKDARSYVMENGRMGM